MSEMIRGKKISLLLLVVIGITALLATGVFAGNDNNGEDMPAIIFQGEEGDLKAWFMENEVRQAKTVFEDVEDGWEVKGVVDADGDGNPDLYLYNRDEGKVELWLMDGLEKEDVIEITNPHPDRDTMYSFWEMMAVYDLNDSGEPDIIWQALEGDYEGELAVWLMEDRSAKDTGRLINHPPDDYTVDPAWEIGAVFDLLGDDEVEVLWHAKEGEHEDELAYWKLDLEEPFERVDSARIINRPPDDPGIKPVWNFRASADLFGDDIEEFLFQHEDGDLAYWRMDVADPEEVRRDASGRLKPREIGTDWTMVGAADFFLADDMKVKSIDDDIEDVTVSYGTEYEDIDFVPEDEVAVTLEDDSTSTVGIEYADPEDADPAYDSDTAGDYEFGYELLSDDYVIPGEYATGTVTVTVAEADVYTVTFKEEGELEEVDISIYEDEDREDLVSTTTTGTDGEATATLIDGDYWFTAEKDKYESYEGDFEVDGADLEVTFELDYIDLEVINVIGLAADEFEVEFSRTVEEDEADQFVLRDSSNYNDLEADFAVKEDEEQYVLMTGINLTQGLDYYLQLFEDQDDPADHRDDWHHFTYQEGAFSIERTDDFEDKMIPQGETEEVLKFAVSVDSEYTAVNLEDITLELTPGSDNVNLGEDEDFKKIKLSYHDESEELTGADMADLEFTEIFDEEEDEKLRIVPGDDPVEFTVEVTVDSPATNPGFDFGFAVKDITEEYGVAFDGAASGALFEISHEEVKSQLTVKKPDQQLTGETVDSNEEHAVFEFDVSNDAEVRTFSSVDVGDLELTEINFRNQGNAPDATGTDPGSDAVGYNLYRWDETEEEWDQVQEGADDLHNINGSEHIKFDVNEVIEEGATAKFRVKADIGANVTDESTIRVDMYDEFEYDSGDKEGYSKLFKSNASYADGAVNLEERIRGESFTVNQLAGAEVSVSAEDPVEATTTLHHGDEDDVPLLRFDVEALNQDVKLENATITIAFDEDDDWEDNDFDKLKINGQESDVNLAGETENGYLELRVTNIDTTIDYEETETFEVTIDPDANRAEGWDLTASIEEPEHLEIVNADDEAAVLVTGSAAGEPITFVERGEVADFAFESGPSETLATNEEEVKLFEFSFIPRYEGLDFVDDSTTTALYMTFEGEDGQGDPFNLDDKKIFGDDIRVYFYVEDDEDEKLGQGFSTTTVENEEHSGVKIDLDSKTFDVDEEQTIYVEIDLDEEVVEGGDKFSFSIANEEGNEDPEDDTYFLGTSEEATTTGAYGETTDKPIQFGPFDEWETDWFEITSGLENAEFTPDPDPLESSSEDNEVTLSFDFLGELEEDGTVSIDVQEMVDAGLKFADADYEVTEGDGDVNYDDGSIVFTATEDTEASTTIEVTSLDIDPQSYGEYDVTFTRDDTDYSLTVEDIEVEKSLYDASATNLEYDRGNQLQSFEIVVDGELEKNEFIDVDIDATNIQYPDDLDKYEVSGADAEVTGVDDDTYTEFEVRANEDIATGTKLTIEVDGVGAPESDIVDTSTYDDTVEVTFTRGDVDTYDEAEFILKDVEPGDADDVLVEADPDIIDVNATTTIIATVIDEYGNKVEGVEVEFSTTTAAHGELSEATSTTDVDGVATTTYTSDLDDADQNITFQAKEMFGNSTSTVEVTVTDTAIVKNESELEAALGEGDIKTIILDYEDDHFEIDTQDVEYIGQGTEEQTVYGDIEVSGDGNTLSDFTLVGDLEVTGDNNDVEGVNVENEGGNVTVDGDDNSLKNVTVAVNLIIGSEASGTEVTSVSVEGTYTDDGTDTKADDVSTADYYFGTVERGNVVIEDNKVSFKYDDQNSKSDAYFFSYTTGDSQWAVEDDSFNGAFELDDSFNYEINEDFFTDDDAYYTDEEGLPVGWSEDGGLWEAMLFEDDDGNYYALLAGSEANETGTFEETEYLKNPEGDTTETFGLVRIADGNHWDPEENGGGFADGTTHLDADEADKAIGDEELELDLIGGGYWSNCYGEWTD